MVGVGAELAGGRSGFGEEVADRAAVLSASGRHRAGKEQRAVDREQLPLGPGVGGEQGPQDGRGVRRAQG